MKNRALTFKILKLSIPNILSNISLPLAAFLDIILLGHSSTIATLAGVALAGLIFDYLYLSFYFLRMGTTGIVSGQEGKKEYEKQILTLCRMLSIAVCAGIILTLFQQPLINFFLALFTAKEEVEEATKIYFNIRIWGAMPLLIVLAVAGWFLGKQRSDIILLLTVTLSGSNAIISYILIYKYKLGAFGAGFGTMASEWICCVLALFMVIRFIKKRYQFTMPSLGKLWNKEAAVLIAKLSSSISLRTFLLVTSYSIFSNLSAIISTNFLAANVILEHLLLTLAYFTDGYAFSLEALAGKYFAGKNFKKLRQSLNISLVIALLTSFVFALIFLLFSDQIYPLINKHPEVIAIAKRHELYFLGAMLLGTVAYIYDGFFIGLADGKTMWQSMIISFFFGFVPFAIAGHILSSTDLLWMSLVCFMAARAITMWAFANRRTFANSNC